MQLLTAYQWVASAIKKTYLLVATMETKKTPDAAQVNRPRQKLTSKNPQKKFKNTYQVAHTIVKMTRSSAKTVRNISSRRVAHFQMQFWKTFIMEEEITLKNHTTDPSPNPSLTPELDPNQNKYSKLIF